MKILLASSGGVGAWFLLRLMREGHQCDWGLIDPQPGQDRTLRGLIPPPLEKEPDYRKYDLVIFDSTGHGDLAEDIKRKTPVIGDSSMASRLEDDRLFGIQIMEQCGIEVPPYAVFSNPNEAKKFLKDSPKRYVYKPFTPPGGEQDCDTTYVSESAEDMIKCLDSLWKDSHNVSFLLQEVVEGTEISTEAYFDGVNFYFHNHTLEEKKFMSGGFGPNTGCSGNLVWTINGPNRLFSRGLAKLQPFLRSVRYKGMIDLNTIVNENHAYGLEWTPRFGYDASASIFSLISSGLGDFLHAIASAPNGGCQFDPTPKQRGDWAASERMTIPPYPEETAKFTKALPVKGIKLEDAWLNCYLWDVMTKKEELITAGMNGIIACPIASAFTPEGAWGALDRLTKGIKIPNLQVRDDLEDCTLRRLKEVREMGWTL
jgi:phosphoribosylamine-glycine ligase